MASVPPPAPPPSPTPPPRHPGPVSSAEGSPVQGAAGSNDERFIEGQLAKARGYVKLVDVVGGLMTLAAGTLIFSATGMSRALTLGFASGNRNMGLVLAVLADKADFDVVVFFAVGQLPMYILPALLRPIYRRMMRSG